MSVAAAPGAGSTQHHQPTAEQIRLAKLIEDKKHDQPEVQDILRKVLDVVANSNQEDALVALFDCDYDYEKTVALLIEKGHEVASEWRTATNHKATKKQQQKTASSKNGHGGETDENGHQRDGTSYRGKSRGGRSRFPQQPNGNDSQNNNQQLNDNSTSQYRPRGGSGYRGRNRGSNRGGYRANDRNYQQQQYESQPQDSNADTSLPSDTTQGFSNVPYANRRGGGGGGGKQQRQWDVGNWNGETMVYSRTSKDDEQPSNSDENNVSNTLQTSSGVTNGQPSSLGTSSGNNAAELNTQRRPKTEFDPVEATRQIKNVIGIGQSQQQHQNMTLPKPLMDLKPLMNDQQPGQQQKSSAMPSKAFVPNVNTKVTPPPPQRIPHQPVIFSDRFDGGMNKIDVQFGNLTETIDDTASHNTSAPISSSSASAFYQRSEPMASVSQQNNTSSTVQNSQRSATTTAQHPPAEQSSFVSPLAQANSTRSFEQQQQQQQPVMNQQRVMPSQLQQQQPSMSMKPVVPPQYAVHPTQHHVNASNVLLQSLLFHQQQQESMPLDSSYDPTAFQLPSMDFNTPYYLAAMSQPPPQQQTQARYLVSQPPPPPQQQQQQQQQQQMHQQSSSNRPQSSNNVQTPPLSTTSSSLPPSSASTTLPSAPKKGPAVPPGMFLSTAPPTQPAYSAAYTAAYGVPPSIGGQQQTGASNYPTGYDAEQLFTNAFMQLANAQQAQSPSGTYGSVTPPVQQQNQPTHNNNDNKAMNYRGPVTEDLLLLQQYQQYSIQQLNSQQQGQQGATHSPAPLNYFLGHPQSGPSYSPGPQIMYAPPGTAMAQQQASKQQGQQYNQNNTSSGMGVNDDYYGRNSSSNKEAQYMYAMSAPPQQVPSQSIGQQQDGVRFLVLLRLFITTTAAVVAPTSNILLHAAPPGSARRTTQPDVGQFPHYQFSMHSRDSRRNYGGNYSNYGYRNGNNTNRSDHRRNHTIPDEPPFTAHVGNAPETMVQGDFEHQLFAGLKVKQVRLVRDRQTDRFRGFAYVDFEDADSLRSAIALDGTCVNDQPVRIDVANRPLDAMKPQGFRNKAGFESYSAPRQSYDNNRPTNNFRQTGGNPRAVSNAAGSNHSENGYAGGYHQQMGFVHSTDLPKVNEQQSQPLEEPVSPNTLDDVFITPITPTSNADEKHDDVHSKEESTIVTRLKSRNWADCIVDEPTTEITPPPTPELKAANSSRNEDVADDFQLVRNKTPKSRTNQQPSTRSTGYQSARGRNGGNYARGIPSSQTFGNERSFYDLTPPSYMNPSAQYYPHYHHDAQAGPPPFQANPGYHHHRQPPSHGSQQRMNSNRSNNNRDYQGERRLISTSSSSDNFNTNAASLENRPRLQLLPRSQKLSSSTDDNQSVESPSRNASIFGCGKPRDEHDPKLAELSKHIEEVVDKEQHLSRTTSTTSNESKSDVAKPVRILSARSDSSTTH